MQQVKHQGPPGEIPEYMVRFKESPPSAAVYYYYYYLSFIHKLISLNLVTPYWLSINDIISIVEKQEVITNSMIRMRDIKDDLNYLSEKFSYFPNNRWLSSMKDEPYLLGADIVNNGAIVPLLTTPGNKQFIMGSHRLGSLIYYHKNIKPITKLFLCLSFNTESKVFNCPGEMGLDIPYLSYRYPSTRFPRDMRDIRAAFDTNGGGCSNLIFDYNKKIENEPNGKYKKIIPAPCLNNQEDFNKFISKPFTDQYLADIAEHYDLWMPFEGNYSDPLKFFFRD